MLTLPLVLPTARAEAGLDVRVQLQLEGKDVTVAHGNDVVQFLPITEGPDGRKPDEVTCLVKDGCEVPLGTYTIDLDAKDFIVETRPELMVEPGGPKPIDVSLSVTPAAHVTVPSLPVGGVLQALDERTAELRSQPVSGPIAELRIPASSAPTTRKRGRWGAGRSMRNNRRRSLSLACPSCPGAVGSSSSTSNTPRATPSTTCRSH